MHIFASTLVCTDWHQAVCFEAQDKCTMGSEKGCGKPLAPPGGRAAGLLPLNHWLKMGSVLAVASACGTAPAMKDEDPNWQALWVISVEQSSCCWHLQERRGWLTAWKLAAEKSSRQSGNSRTITPVLVRAARALGKGARRKRSVHVWPLLLDITISTTATSSSEDLLQQAPFINELAGTQSETSG
jgi:hypothetical protein